MNDIRQRQNPRRGTPLWVPIFFSVATFLWMFFQPGPTTLVDEVLFRAGTGACFQTRAGTGACFKPGQARGPAPTSRSKLGTGKYGVRPYARLAGFSASISHFIGFSRMYWRTADNSSSLRITLS